ncbi:MULTISPECIES: hypothetical protein [Pseudomonas syringae group]|uniref:hypothetical protein n=1 Tax=Pseudomonas syringae group TaxID=136849 RepID=UPI0011C3CF76|nr:MULTISPECIES: hypothetical protein [Pseudomonas syringae group]MCF5805686.1 hypothetical protein [Pseudomonas tremae]MCF5811470.1 hypothetical protein [Pseudomonas tremae]
MRSRYGKRALASRWHFEGGDLQSVVAEFHAVEKKLIRRAVQVLGADLGNEAASECVGCFIALGIN